MRQCGSSRERGASLVEFALIVPLLTLFLFGIVQFGIAYDKQQSINSAAREGDPRLPRPPARSPRGRRMTGVYDRIAAILPTLPAEIDEEAGQVRVAWDVAMPPRTAQWRDGLGCAGLPIGARAEDGARIPAFATTNGLVTFDERPWPMGDAGAEAAMPRRLTELERVVGAAFEHGDFGGRTSAIVVVRDGRIVAERYIEGHDRHTSQRTWSVAKSLAGTLIGHAVQRGLTGEILRRFEARGLRIIYIAEQRRDARGLEGLAGTAGKNGAGQDHVMVAVLFCQSLADLLECPCCILERKCSPLVARRRYNYKRNIRAENRLLVAGRCPNAVFVRGDHLVKPGFLNRSTAGIDRLDRKAEFIGQVHQREALGHRSIPAPSQ